VTVVAISVIQPSQSDQLGLATGSATLRKNSKFYVTELLPY